MSTIIDVLVDAPLLGILPQRISIDLAHVSDMRSVLSQIQAGLVTTGGHAVSFPSNAVLNVGEPGAGASFAPMSSIVMQLTPLARLRVSPPPSAPHAADLSAAFSSALNESRAFDPNAPVIGVLSVTIVRCEGLLNRGRYGATSSPYVIAYGQGSKEVFRTSIVASELCPEFPEEAASFEMPLNEFCGHMRFRVMAQAFMDHFMGEAIVEVADVVGKADQGELTLPLQSRRHEIDEDILSAETLGTVTIRYRVTLADDDYEPQTVDVAGMAAADNDGDAAQPAPVDEAVDPTIDAAPAVVIPPSKLRQNLTQLSAQDTTDVMLDVVKIVVADAVATIADHTYELSLRKLDVIRAGVMEDRALLGAIPDADVSQRFFAAIMGGFQLGTRNWSAIQNENALLRQTVDGLNAELDALQRRLNESLNALEASREQQLTKSNDSQSSYLRSPPCAGNRAPPCTPSTQHAPDDQQRENPSPLPVGEQLSNAIGMSTGAATRNKAVTEAHVLAQDRNTQKPRVHTDVNAMHADPTTTAEVGDGAAAEPNAEAAACTELAEPPTDDTAIDFTMVVCFYNAFDYVTKSTRKKGRAVSLSSTKTETRFDVLCRIVAATFREGLSIAYANVDGQRQIIESDEQLTALLINLKKHGYRPVFQCYSPDEEHAMEERVIIGSSPKRMFAIRSPSRPEPPSAQLVSRPLTASRPSSASLSHRERPMSAMSALSTASSLPFDYIAGSALDDDAIAREFDIVSGGESLVSKADVLTYLEARYDAIGQPKRFASLIDGLFRRKQMLGLNEFAIVLLRLSQS